MQIEVDTSTSESQRKQNDKSCRNCQWFLEVSREGDFVGHLRIIIRLKEK